MLLNTLIHFFFFFKCFKIVQRFVSIIKVKIGFPKLKEYQGTKHCLLALFFYRHDLAQLVLILYHENIYRKIKYNSNIPLVGHFVHLYSL